MHTAVPHWRNYWYELRFREPGTLSFEPLGSGGRQQVPNKALATRSLEQYVEGFLDQASDELDSLHGELQMILYTEATPGPNTKPVLVRTVKLGRG